MSFAIFCNSKFRFGLGNASTSLRTELFKVHSFHWSCFHCASFTILDFAVWIGLRDHRPITSRQLIEQRRPNLAALKAGYNLCTMGPHILFDTGDETHLHKHWPACAADGQFAQAFLCTHDPWRDPIHTGRLHSAKCRTTKILRQSDLWPRHCHAPQNVQVQKLD